MLCQINIYSCVVRSHSDWDDFDQDNVGPGILLWDIHRIATRGFKGRITDTVLDQVLGTTRRLSSPQSVNTNSTNTRFA
jgi:hypothetical protein